MNLTKEQLVEILNSSSYSKEQKEELIKNYERNWGDIEYLVKNVKNADSLYLIGNICFEKIHFLVKEGKLDVNDIDINMLTDDFIWEFLSKNTATDEIFTILRVLNKDNNFDENIYRLGRIGRNRIRNYNNDYFYPYFRIFPFDTLPEKLTHFIIDNIYKPDYLLIFLKTSSCPISIKNYIMNTRRDDIIEAIDYNDTPIRRFYGDCDYPNEILELLVNKIRKDELLEFLEDRSVNDKIIDKILELRKSDLKELTEDGNNIIKIANANFSDKVIDYLLKDINISVVLDVWESSLTKPSERIYNLKKEEIRDYYYRLPCFDEKWGETQNVISDMCIIYSDLYLYNIYKLNDKVYFENDFDLSDYDVEFMADDIVIDYNDTHIIGLFLRFSHVHEYRNLLSKLFDKKSNIIIDYVKEHPEDIRILYDYDVDPKIIEDILSNAPCTKILSNILTLPINNSNLVFNEEFLRDIIEYLYFNNKEEVLNYLEQNPKLYYTVYDLWCYKVNDILKEISDETAIEIIFFNKQFNLPLSLSEAQFVYDIFLIKKDTIIEYLALNYAKILDLFNFMYDNNIKNVLLNLPEKTVIDMFFDKGISNGTKVEKENELRRLIYSLKKNIIFNSLEKNEYGFGYEILLEYDLDLSEDLSRIINNISDDTLLRIFSSFGKEHFKEKKEFLYQIFMLKKDLILLSFIDNPDDYFFILSFDLPEDTFGGILDKVSSESFYKLLGNSFYSKTARLGILKKIFNNKKIVVEESLVEDMFSLWDKLSNDGTDKIILDKYPVISDLITKCNLSFNKMFQYEANARYNWIKGINDIIESDNINNFINFKNKYFEKYFDMNKVESNIQEYECFLLLVEIFNRYPDLCINIAKNEENLSEEDINKLMYLFNTCENFVFSERPKALTDLDNIHNMAKSSCLALLNNSYGIRGLKENLSIIIFNTSLNVLKDYLKTYGNRENFIRLRFNNRNNKEILDYIDEMLVYVSFIEDFINCDDLDSLKDIANNISNYFEEVSNISVIFNGFEKKMRNLFEIEANINLTDISNKEIYNKVLNKELSDKYGVDVLDFRDKEYLFYAHVVSDRENIEDLVEGKSTSGSNFISLSAIGNRNNRYYWSGNHGIKVLYSKIKKGSYVMSSVSNMGSNALLSKNSTKVIETEREQRGLIENVDAPGSNSEAIYYRDGLIPSGFNTYEGDRYFDEAIEEAKKYGLPIILTQGKNKTITNPIPLEEEKNNDFSNIDKYKELRDKLNRIANLTPKNSTRKIAILADSHALFEPTLAILEDARRQGITEIYSLGDNIGTGPNPGEVVDLLESYNVKSVKGNHELYTLLGTDQFKEHLHGTALKEAEENSNWTRLHLTDRQLEIIREYPDKIELNINGKKVLLTHYIKDLNTDEVIVDKDNYDQIFQGHIHHKNDEENISTLRGVGIGSSNREKEKAFYIVLTEKDGGGFNIEDKYVPYDTNSLYHDINESSLSEHDKSKITSWTGVSRR